MTPDKWVDVFRRTATSDGIDAASKELFDGFGRELEEEVRSTQPSSDSAAGLCVLRVGRKWNQVASQIDYIRPDACIQVMYLNDEDVKGWIDRACRETEWSYSLEDGVSPPTD